MSCRFGHRCTTGQPNGSVLGRWWVGLSVGGLIVVVLSATRVSMPGLTTDAVADERSAARIDKQTDDPGDLAAEVIDPDAGGELLIPVQRATAGFPPGPDCNLIGNVDFAFGPFINRYRGNVYRVQQEATLKEIKMELAFANPTDLIVAIHQRQGDGTYSRYAPDVNLVGAVGLGATTFDWYSTAAVVPNLNLVLEPGFDYAIAFAWKPGVTFGRDDLDYPIPFEVGTVRGSVGVTLPSTGDPFVPDVFPATPPLNLTIFTGGAYSQQLCFEPEPGACCSATSQSCVEVFESQCTGEGSFFHGQRTICEETICVFGACCTRCGTCGDNYTADSCALNDGVAFWSNLSCPAEPATLCPKVNGACCGINGQCILECESLCSGVYQGDGTECDPNPCRGACCISGFGCGDRTAASCASFNGAYRGDGTTCADLAPEDECGGACCYGQTGLTNCQRVSPRSVCAFDAFPFTAYRGDGSTCPQTCGVITDYGACCLPDGTCINTTSAACSAVGVYGEFNASFRCEGLNNGCPNVKACCLPDGQCHVLTNTGCTAEGGARPAGEPLVCGTSTCRTGACCIPGPEICRITTDAACVSAGGSYRGNGTDCAVPAEICPGLGACCREDGDCLDSRTLAECTVIDGAHSPGEVCDGGVVECASGAGACCATTGLCLTATPSECATIGGEFKGAATPCGEQTCPTGACCLTDSCEILTAAGCAAESGTYQGDDAPCLPDPCHTGACCAGGPCSVETESACLAAEGRYFGDNVPCDDELCLIGACCGTDCSCTDGLLASDCTAAGSTFVPGGLCAENACSPRIADSNPPNCAIDARQPHEPGPPQPPPVRQGWNTIALTFTCDASNVGTEDFTVTVVVPPKDPQPTPPTITQAVASLNMVTLTFDRIIDLKAWTCVTHDASGTQACLGVLPADVNGDGDTHLTEPPPPLDSGISPSPDQQALLEYLREEPGSDLKPWQCDLDRSGLCTPADLLMEVDLLYGEGAFDAWLNVTIPDCPSAPAP